MLRARDFASKAPSTVSGEAIQCSISLIATSNELFLFIAVFVRWRMMDTLRTILHTNANADFGHSKKTFLKMIEKNSDDLAVSQIAAVYALYL